MALHLLVLLLLKLLLHVLLLLLLMHSSLKRVGQPQELGLHRHAVARALLCCRRHHHVEVVHQLRGVRVQGDVRSSTARGRHPLLRGPHLPDGATLELLCGEDVLGLGLEFKRMVYMAGPECRQSFEPHCIYLWVNSINFPCSDSLGFFGKSKKSTLR